MRRSFIIDVDHMSDLATDATLDLVERYGYPVVASHTSFRDLMFGSNTIHEHKDALGRITHEVRPNTSISYENTHDLNMRFGSANAEAYASERARSSTQLEPIRNLGGMVGVGTGAAVVPYSVARDGQVRTVADCDGTTKSMAQLYLYLVDQMRGRGVALGTDMNGLPDSLKPRFGPSACGGAIGDAPRMLTIAAQVAAQRNGVRYATASKHSWGRFKPAPGHPWERDFTTWAAVERFRGGDASRWGGDGAERAASRMVYGFYRQSRGEPLMADRAPDVFDDVRLAQRAYAEIHGAARSGDPKIERIRAVWDAYHRVEGDNPPLVKSALGTTDFDFNLDGLVHYGLLPDMLQDVRDIGLTDADLAPLFHGAEYHARMWERIEAASAVVRAAHP